MDEKSFAQAGTSTAFGRKERLEYSIDEMASWTLFHSQRKDTQQQENGTITRHARLRFAITLNENDFVSPNESETAELVSYGAKVAICMTQLPAIMLAVAL
jgi:hypothetical protein